MVTKLVKKIQNCLGKPSKKILIESVSMLTPPSDPTPPSVSALGYFFSQCFFNYLGRLVRGETDFENFGLNWIKTMRKKDGQNLTY